MDNLMVRPRLFVTFASPMAIHNMLKLKDGFSGERALVLPRPVLEKMAEDPLIATLHITDIGYYPKAAHHFRERKEPVDQYVCIYCVDGRGWYRVGEKRHEVVANQYFILPAGKPHAYGANDNEPWTIYWVHFKGNLAPYYANDALMPMNVKPSPHSRISNRINLFEDIYSTLQSGFGLENLRYASSLFHYFLGTLRYINQYRQVDSSRVDDDNITEVIIHYMNENIEKRITLHDISDYLGYSTPYYSALFKRKTGHSPMAYLNILRIQRACQMLDSTRMKVNQICYKTGIRDAYYFSRLFSKTMGMSPKQYRELKKG